MVAVVAVVFFKASAGAGGAASARSGTALSLTMAADSLELESKPRA